MQNIFHILVPFKLFPREGLHLIPGSRRWNLICNSNDFAVKSEDTLALEEVVKVEEWFTTGPRWFCDNSGVGTNKNA